MSDVAQDSRFGGDFTLDGDPPVPVSIIATPEDDGDDDPDFDPYELPAVDEADL